MSKYVKELMTKELQSHLSGTQDCFVVSFSKIDANEMCALRRSLREQQVTMKLVKNSLARRALERMDRASLVPYLEGPSAVAYGAESVVDLAKALHGFAKKNKQFVIRGGLVEGESVGPESAEVLALIPSRDALLAQIAGMILGPLRNLVGAVNALAQKTAGLLDAYREKLEKGAGDDGAEDA